MSSDSTSSGKALLPAARRTRILADIRSKGMSSIRELSQRYQVSEMTIRRDLEDLAGKGLVARTYGGAVESSGAEQQFSAKKAVNEDIKRSLAAAAAEAYVHPGDVIIIGGGTTVAAMGDYLGTIPNLIVVTNSLVTAIDLTKSLHSSSTVISVGGIVRGVSHTATGPVVQTFFREFHANALFLSAVGYVDGLGFMDPNMAETEVKQAMMNAADRLVMLVDSSKYGKKSLMTSVPLERVDAVITDAGTPEHVLREFRERGIEVCIAEPAGPAGCTE